MKPMKTKTKYFAIITLALASFLPKDVDAQTQPNTTPWEVVGNMFSHQITGTDEVWNGFRTEEERINRLEEYLSNFKWDHGDYRGWVCANHVEQMQIDMNGIENIEEFVQIFFSNENIKYYSSKNGEGKIPFYHVQVRHKNGEAHGIGGVLIGENPLNFNDWYFIDYATLKRVYPGDDAMNKDGYANIGLRAYVENAYFSGKYAFDFIDNLIRFDLQNGEATMVDYNESIKVIGENRTMPFVILDNPNDDKVHVQSLEEEVLNYEPNLTMTIPHLESKGYTVTPNVTTENTSLEPEIINEYKLISQDPNGFFSDWEFITTGTISSGGVTNLGSETQSVKVRDTEKPVIPYQGKITVLQEDFEEEASKYTLNATDNTKITDSTKTLNKISENNDKIIYELRGEVTDLGGNITEGKAAEIEVLKAKLSVKTIESKVVNYPGDTSPASTGIPEYTTENTKQTPIYSYTDSDPTSLDANYPEIHYEFTRTHAYTIQTLSLTSSSTQKITSVDLEAPKFTIPENRTLYQYQVPVGGLNPKITGYPTNITDNSGLAVDTNVVYSKTSEENNKINYNATWTATDVFGNSASKTEKVTILKSSITISKLEDKLINYQLDLDLSPEVQGKPTISTVNTQGTPIYFYFDSDTTILNSTYPNINYSFVRTHIGSVENIADSSNQKITIADIEAPQNGKVPDEITITEEQVEINGGLSPAITGGYITGETDNSSLPIERVVSFTKISEDEENEIYNAT